MVGSGWHGNNIGGVWSGWGKGDVFGVGISCIGQGGMGVMWLLLGWAVGRVMCVGGEWG